MNNGMIYVKANDDTIANCYRQFFQDVLKSKSLYSIKRQDAVKHIIKGLSESKTYRQSIGGADAEYEEVLADIIRDKHPDSCTAEDLNLTNAIGYDICSQNDNIFIEAKLYTVSARSGRISANISNIENKFCTIIALVIDPYILDRKKYRLYAIPPDAIPSDTSEYLDIPHHSLTNIDNIQLCNQYEPLGLNKSQYEISIDDIQNCKYLNSVNMKRLALCLRKLENMQHGTSDLEFQVLYELFVRCIRIHNKKSKKKFTTDFKDQIYDYGTSRLFFKDAKIICVQQESQDEEL